MASVSLVGRGVRVVPAEQASVAAGRVALAVRPEPATLAELVELAAREAKRALAMLAEARPPASQSPMVAADAASRPHRRTTLQAPWRCSESDYGWVGAAVLTERGDRPAEVTGKGLAQQLVDQLGVPRAGGRQGGQGRAAGRALAGRQWQQADLPVCPGDDGHPDGTSHRSAVAIGGFGNERDWSAWCLKVDL